MPEYAHEDANQQLEFYHFNISTPDFPQLQCCPSQTTPFLHLF